VGQSTGRETRRSFDAGEDKRVDCVIP
jgi:hypothetical protein